MGDEQDVLALTDGLMTNSLSQMALARAGWAADEYWTGLAHEATGQQVTGQASVEGRTGGKVELLYRFAGDQRGFLEQQCASGLVAPSQFVTQEHLQKLQVAELLLNGLPNPDVERVRHA